MVVMAWGSLSYIFPDGGSENEKWQLFLLFFRIQSAGIFIESYSHIWLDRIGEDKEKILLVEPAKVLGRAYSESPLFLCHIWHFPEILHILQTLGTFKCCFHNFIRNKTCLLSLLKYSRYFKDYITHYTLKVLYLKSERISQYVFCFVLLLL